jgi:hypothetical protein
MTPKLIENINEFCQSLSSSIKKEKGHNLLIAEVKERTSLQIPWTLKYQCNRSINKFDNLDEMDQIIKRYNLSKFKTEENSKMAARGRKQKATLL